MKSSSVLGEASPPGLIPKFLAVATIIIWCEGEFVMVDELTID